VLKYALVAPALVFLCSSFVLADKAMEVADHGNYQRALQLWISDSKNHPESDKPLFFAAEIYQLLGKPGKAASFYRRLSATVPDSELADDSLFRLARIFDHDFRDAKTALSLYSTLIKQYPKGKLKESVKFDDQVKYERSEPIRAYMHYARYKILRSLKRYTAALEELTSAVEIAEQDSIYEINDLSIQRFVIEYYDQTGELLIARRGIIYLSADEQCRSIDLNGATFQTHVVLAANPGFFLKSLTLSFEKTAYPMHADVNDPFFRLFSETTRNIREKREVDLFPWTTITAIDIYPDDHEEYQKHNSSVGSLLVCGSLKPAEGSGTLSVISNTKSIVTVDPAAGIAVEPHKSWLGAPWRDTPFTIWKMPAGKHEVRIYGKGHLFGWNLSGKKEVHHISLQPSGRVRIQAHFPPLDDNPLIVLPSGWKDFLCVSHRIRVGTLHDGYASGWIQLFQDEKDVYHLFWNQDYDIYTMQSRNGSIWSNMRPLKRPINSEGKEGNFQLHVSNDGNYWLFFQSVRLGGMRILVSKSRDLVHWSDPITVDQSAYGNWFKNFKALRSESGEWLVYYHIQSEGMRLRKSGDGHTWVDGRLQMPDQLWEVFSLIQDHMGRFWMASIRNGVFLQSSNDGIQWSEAKQIVAAGERPANPILMQNREKTYLLAWETGGQLKFSSSKDAENWTVPGGTKENVHQDLYPSTMFSVMEERSGTYRLAFIEAEFRNRNLCLAESQSPASQ